MRNILAMITLIVLFSCSWASAQFLGQLTPAPTLNRGEALLGAYMGVYEDAFSLFGQFRYGIARYLDLGFKMGMIDLDPGYESSTGLTVGGDVKHWFMDKSSGDLMDFSVGAGTEYLGISDFSVFSVGGNIIGSYQIGYDQKNSVTPYGRLNIRWEKQTFKRGLRNYLEKESDSDLNVAIAFGAELKLYSDLLFVGELQIDDNVGFLGGINYTVF